MFCFFQQQCFLFSTKFFLFFRFGTVFVPTEDKEKKDEDPDCNLL